MPTRIVLLRGINLGLSRRVAMADVRQALIEAGFGDAQSLLQSGNLVLQTDAEDKIIEAAVEAALHESLGLTTEAMVRSPAAWQEMIEANPFQEEAECDPGHLVAVIMKTLPSPDAEAAVNNIEGPERVRVRGREAFIYYPNGQARSKVAGARLDQALGARGTARNWNTIVKLAAMAGC